MQITSMQKEFEIKKLGEQHYLHFKSDTLLWADVFKNFRKMCLKIYHLDPGKFLSAPALALQAPLKMIEKKIRIVNWYWHATNGWKKN